MPSPAVSLLASVLAAALLALAGCGEEEAQLLPGGTAREITANLEAVERLADEGDCLGAESATGQVDEQVEALDEVDPRLKRALERGVDRLQEVVARCEEEGEAAEPEPSELEADEDALGEEERKEEDALKEEEKREKEEEKQDESREKEEEGDDGEGEGSPELPPQAEGEAKGQEGEGGPPPAAEGGGTSSGGVSPANPAGGGG
ncbi:MAG TPA: hypothetical protein VFU04_03670 [Solirubrobacterales bacterium]|nr:hypothetical protein [Solirubrobacterales bacterium]